MNRHHIRMANFIGLPFSWDSSNMHLYRMINSANYNPPKPRGSEHMTSIKIPAVILSCKYHYVYIENKVQIR